MGARLSRAPRGYCPSCGGILDSPMRRYDIFGPMADFHRAADEKVIAGVLSKRRRRDRQSALACARGPVQRPRGSRLPRTRVVISNRCFPPARARLRPRSKRGIVPKTVDGPKKVGLGAWWHHLRNFRQKFCAVAFFRASIRLDESSRRSQTICGYRTVHRLLL